MSSTVKAIWGAAALVSGVTIVTTILVADHYYKNVEKRLEYYAKDYVK